MAEAKVSRGKVISITYTIRDQADDNLLEAVEIPVDYLHGGRVGLYRQIEDALEGKAVGESVEVLLTPDDAFGPRDPGLTFTDVLENVPPEFRRLGAQAEFTNEAGETVTMTVTHIDAGTITLDGNHPLAGKNLIFAVRVAAIRDATPQELMTGEVAQAQGLH
ncbi:FKBP-type peptidyl-prolyl cis-trans isomerase [Sulfurivermis fontis]|uniref:FKBP-type peptidyl-prolyl cis-trans isomerase n=1 Tax=Sulfurivermis fontis TaxID=1972068 RepID=UPI000FDC5232|nr:peptidylprolyl isomerase [Sulfurivermis fontis]